MIFSTREDLRKRLEYIWDFADKNSDVDFLLDELWKDIEETKYKNLNQPNVSNSVFYVTIKDNIKAPYWTALHHNEAFKVKKCTSIDEIENKGLNNMDTENYYIVVSGEYKGCVIYKKHCY